MPQSPDKKTVAKQLIEDKAKWFRDMSDYYKQRGLLEEAIEAEYNAAFCERRLKVILSDSPVHATNYGREEGYTSSESGSSYAPSAEEEACAEEESSGSYISTPADSE